MAVMAGRSWPWRQKIQLRVACTVGLGGADESSSIASCSRSMSSRLRTRVRRGSGTAGSPVGGPPQVGAARPGRGLVDLGRLGVAGRAVFGEPHAEGRGVDVFALRVALV